MKKSVLVHDHKFGSSVYFFKSKASVKKMEENIHSLCEQLDIDFEEDFETIIIEPIPSPFKKIIL